MALSPAASRATFGANHEENPAQRSRTHDRRGCGDIVTKLYARAVFFAADAGASLSDYVDRLGFTEEWMYEEAGKPYVFQVSLLGFEVIINQVDADNSERAGHGRVYIGLEDDQIGPVIAHIQAKNIATERRNWGQPTLVVRDLDGNEIFFWDWPDKPRDSSSATEHAEP